MTPTDDELVALARDIPFAPPPRDRVEQMRTSVLADMPPPRAPRQLRWWMLAPIAAAPTIVLILVWWLVRAEPVDGVQWGRRGAVRAIGAAVFVEVGDVADEQVRLVDGNIHVDVHPLAPGERFRVVTGDGEVEVRGTAFDVRAEHGHLASVTVEHGRVDVRFAGEVHRLGVGDRWEAAIVAAAPPAVPRAPPPAPAPPPPPAVRHVARPAPVAPDPLAVERVFREGWDALRRDDAGVAAAAFDRALALDRSGGLAEDSAYWRAVAYQRAGRADAANAFEQFLADHAASPHSGEAAALLGDLLLAAGDLDGAAARFRTAAADPSPRVSTLGRKGLAEITRRRPR